MLHPENLARFGARRFEPDAVIAEVVDDYWSVTWNLDPGETIDQVIIASPAVTLTVEEGDVPGRHIVTGVHRRAWTRRISGSGRVFGIRLRPAGLRVCTDLSPDVISDRTIVLDGDLDRRGLHLLQTVGGGADPRDMARRADGRIAELLSQRPLEAHERLANQIVADIVSGRHPQYRASERTVQRALKQTLGQGPKWVSRWVRLQEVAHRLADPRADAAAIAPELGYVDQPHLVSDFRSAVGTTPGAYARELRALFDDRRSG